MRAGASILLMIGICVGLPLQIQPPTHVIYALAPNSLDDYTTIWELNYNEYAGSLRNSVQRQKTSSYDRIDSLINAHDELNDSPRLSKKSTILQSNEVDNARPSPPISFSTINPFGENNGFEKRRNGINGFVNDCILLDTVGLTLADSNWKNGPYDYGQRKKRELNDNQLMIEFNQAHSGARARFIPRSVATTGIAVALTACFCML